MRIITILQNTYSYMRFKQFPGPNYSFKWIFCCFMHFSTTYHLCIFLPTVCTKSYWVSTQIVENIRVVVVYYWLRITFKYTHNLHNPKQFSWASLSELSALFKEAITNSAIELKTSIKSNLSLYSLYYAKAWNESVGTISAPLRLSNIASFKEMSKRWRAVGNTAFDLTGPRFEPWTSRSRDERVTARPTSRQPADRAVMPSSLEREIRGSNLWPPHFFERSYVARQQWRKDGPCQLITRFGVMQRA